MVLSPHLLGNYKGCGNSVQRTWDEGQIYIPQDVAVSHRYLAWQQLEARSLPLSLVGMNTPRRDIEIQASRLAYSGKHETRDLKLAFFLSHPNNIQAQSQYAGHRNGNIKQNSRAQGPCSTLWINNGKKYNKF